MSMDRSIPDFAARTARCAGLAALGAVVLATLPAHAQVAVDSLAGNWVGDSIEVVAGEMPGVSADALAVALRGNASEFEAEWSAPVIDDGDIEWERISADFEAARRPGYFQASDEVDIFDGEPLMWAFSGADAFDLGRLQLDEDSGRRMLVVYRLIPGDGVLSGVLTISTDDVPVARALFTMVRR
ncbi:MAG: hypothetical protein R3F55_15660 [Alphaproteobacteria bacterium]